MQPCPDIFKHKTLLRKEFRTSRHSLTAAEKKQAAKKATTFFMESHLFKYHSFGLYLPHDGEFETEPLIEALWQAKKKCYLPSLNENNTLLFHLYLPTSFLKKNRYQIDEIAHPEETLPPSQLDVVLTPLVAFDSQGNRLGMGGGFYDKTFQFRLEDASHPLLIGLAFEAQKAPALPKEKWDVPLDAILTERGLNNVR